MIANATGRTIWVLCQNKQETKDLVTNLIEGTGYTIHFHHDASTLLELMWDLRTNSDAIPAALVAEAEEFSMKQTIFDEQISLIKLYLTKQFELRYFPTSSDHDGIHHVFNTLRPKLQIQDSNR